MWNERFSTREFVFGTEAADFLKTHAGHIPESSEVLAVADGEGRNSVYLAGQGHRVTAFDASPVGIDKARGLAQSRGVEVDYHVSGIEDWDWTRQFDALVAIFIQFMGPDMRAQVFDTFRQAVKPGGMLLLHGYAPRQVEYGTGGPKARENMYTEDLLRGHFGDWEILVLADYDADLDEGPGHSGRSGLVDLVARKPA